MTTHQINPEKVLKAKQLEVNSLLEITQAINSNLSAEHLFKIFEFIIRGQIGAERMAIFYNDNDSWSCVTKYGNTEDISSNTIPVGLMSFKQTSHLAHHENKILNQFDYVIPIYNKGAPKAFILVGKFRASIFETSAEEKIKFVETLSNVIIVAIQNKALFEKQLEQEALKKELEVAGQMQKMLVPEQLPSNESLEMAAVYVPHHNIGGDYYDAIQLEDGSTVLCIADISGKGIPAALLMSNFQANLRLLVKQKYELTDIVRLLNSRVSEVANGDKFITFFIAQWNPESRELHYINAGHNAPILYDPEKDQSELLEKGCTLLGIFDDLPTIEEGIIQVDPKSVLFSYTDGVTELENNTSEQYEIERLTKFVRKHHSASMQDFNTILYRELNDYRQDQPFNDDVTFLSTRFL